VAGTKPPHLRCIFPEMAMFDMYSFVYPGGVFHHEFLGTWNFITRTCDLNIPAVFPPVAPVDDDPQGVRLQEAILQHLFNGDVLQIAASAPFRDSADAVTGQRLHIDLSPSRFVEGLNDSEIPVYHLGSWYDIWPRDTLLWYANLDNPQKVVMCPGPHMYSDHAFLAAEHLRWYDYWLKGIENGVMDEPPIHYFTMGEEQGKEWRAADEWPLRNEIPLRFYFHRGRTGSVNSANDGFLRALPSRRGSDSCEVDYSTTTGLANRWTNAYGGPFDYPDMTANDEKGLTYTTRPLPCDMRITGHPVVHLWVTSTAADGDFFAYLEEVDAQGVSNYITEGTLRASHRKLSKPAHDNLRLPWHRSYLEDMSPLPEGTPVRLVFDLHPTSNVFDEGNRIRVTITCADKDNNLTPELSPPPTVTVHRGCRKGSFIKLPIVVDLDR
jgi:putative CocE/NonD family hydrolase